MSAAATEGGPARARVALVQTLKARQVAGSSQHLCVRGTPRPEQGCGGGVPCRCPRRSPPAVPAIGLGAVGFGGAQPPPQIRLGGTWTEPGPEALRLGLGGKGWRREEELAATSLSPAACLRGDEDGGAGVSATAAVVAVRRDGKGQRAARVSAKGGVPACRRP